MKTLAVALFFIVLTSSCVAQVHLYHMPANLSVPDAQQFILKNKKVWIDKNVNVGDLLLKKSGYYIMMGGRATVQITGNITNDGNNFIGNGDINGTIINQKGYLKLNCVNINVPKDGIGVDVAGGKVTAQTCRAASGKNCMVVRNKGELEVFGGNYRSSSECHIKQLDNGHLHVYGTGFQMSQGVDIEITGPSFKGCHFIEGSRSETGVPITSVMVYVPQTSNAVNVYMRANSYTTGKSTIVNYNANGTLFLVGNCNYSNENLGSKQPSVLVTSGNVISIGNNYGNTLDSNTFHIDDNAAMESIGDMTRIDQKQEPRTTPIENTKPFRNVAYVTQPKEKLPTVDAIQPIDFQSITNISELGIATVEQYGASVKNADNSDAISAALQANKLVLLSGFYKVTKPVQITGHLGGGLWGIGADKSGIISSSGTGCINVESMGYSQFKDFSLIIPDTASKAVNLNFGWLDNASSKGGSALQNTVFYNLEIQNGAVGLDIGNKLMGSELWIYNCNFIQKELRKGTASQLDNYNALSDNFVNCNFSGWNVAVNLQKGYGNIINSVFNNVGAGLSLGSQVGNGILFSNSHLDGSCGDIFTTPNSSSRTAIVLDRIKIDYSDIKKDAGLYMQGGTVVIQNSDLGNRTFSLNGGIGQKLVIPDAKSKASISTLNNKFQVHNYKID
jgi:hypothetical protein